MNIWLVTSGEPLPLDPLPRNWFRALSRFAMAKIIIGRSGAVKNGGLCC